MIKSKKKKEKVKRDEPTDKKPVASSSSKHSKHEGKEVIIMRKDFESCNACQDSKKTNLTRFSFECGHWFHQECYELLKLRFNGSLCPLCYSDERFNYLYEDIASSSSKLMRLDIDNSFSKITSDLFYNRRKNGEIWNNIEGMCDLRTMLNIEPSEIDLYSTFDPSDHGTVLKRANNTLNKELDQAKVKNIRKLFTKKTPVEKIISMRYTVSDIKMAGITLDFMLSYGYNIKDIFNIGFRTWKDLKDIKFSPNAMTLLDAENNAYVDIQFLVDYYHISYKDLIIMFSFNHLAVVKNDEVAYQKAIMEFCRLNLKKDELIKLKLININVLFNIFGENCFNADCMVEFCKGDGINKANVLQHVFKFDGDTMNKIKGWTGAHLEALRWSEDHFFGSMIKKKLEKQYGIKDGSDSDSDSDSEYLKEYDDSEDDESEELEESSYEENDDDEGPSNYVDTGISFTDKRFGSISSSVLPKIQTTPYSNSSNISSPSVDNQPKIELPNTAPKVIRRRGLLEE